MVKKRGEKKPEHDDFPRMVIIILIIIAVCISVFATWTVMSHLDQIKSAPVAQAPVQGGKVSITVADPQEEVSSAQGQVSVEIQEGEE